MVESDQAGESSISTVRMSDSGLAQRAQEWLSGSRHVKVPSNWVEACVDWVLQENGRAPVSQAYVNEQALEQWLYTDLRVLAHPVLPPLGRVMKTELRGIFCVQMNSVLDISRPAYVQLQQRRGTDCSNDQVAAVTQATQRPWEASPIRMLMLQLTDGVQDVEALEYKPVPILSADLPPGTKLLLQGVLQCRLGVLLLTPDNVRVLGGAVEELQVALSQSRVLARILDLPEEEQPAAAAPEGEPGHRDVDVSDEELLASLEVAADSGYGSRNEQPHPSPAVQHSVSVADIDEDFDDLPLDELDSVIFLEDSNPAQEVEPDVIEVEPEPVVVEPRISGAGSKSVVESRTSRVGRESLEVELIASSVGRELVEVEPRASRVGRESVEVELIASSVGRELVEVEPRASRMRRESVEAEPRTSWVGRESVEVEPRPSRVGREAVEVELRASSGCESMGVEPRTSRMRRDLARVVPKASSVGCAPVDAEPRTSRMGYESVEEELRTSRAGCDLVEVMARANGTGCEPATSARAVSVGIDSITPPFTYLCVLERTGVRQAQVKAFIITLQGSLRSSSGAWQVSVTISDGTGYLDVRLSDSILASLIGFTVAESRALRKDPERQHEVSAGLQRCQRELVDMCCLMTLQYDPATRTGTVLSADQVTEDTCRELESRVRSRNRH